MLRGVLRGFIQASGVATAYVMAVTTLLLAEAAERIKS